MQSFFKLFLIHAVFYIAFVIENSLVYFALAGQIWWNYKKGTSSLCRLLTVAVCAFIELAIKHQQIPNISCFITLSQPLPPSPRSVCLHQGTVCSNTLKGALRESVSNFSLALSDVTWFTFTCVCERERYIPICLACSYMSRHVRLQQDMLSYPSLLELP